MAGYRSHPRLPRRATGVKHRFLGRGLIAESRPEVNAVNAPRKQTSDEMGIQTHSGLLIGFKCLPWAKSVPTLGSNSLERVESKSRVRLKVRAVLNWGAGLRSGDLRKFV